ncbi:MAG: aminoglycoside phosphotransferase family protein [Anaerolineae bacterium]
MLEKPALSDVQIITSLSERYAIPVDALSFLPIGNDATAWVYRVESGGLTYFLKVKHGAIYEPSLSVPRYLYDAGIKQVVAPYPTPSQHLSVAIEGYNLILYPFIEGHAGGLSDAQRIELGAVMKRIHSTTLPSSVQAQIRKERFIPPWLKTVQKLHEAITRTTGDTPIAREFIDFCRERQDEIGTISARAESLGRLARERAMPIVVCHADIHDFNTIISSQGELFVVDWDEVQFAPKERDLMFVGNVETIGAHVPPHTRLFYEGYGAVKVDPLLIAYYRYEWVVQEMGDFGARILHGQELGEATRQDALDGFRKLFADGNVVDAAYAADVAE